MRMLTMYIHKMLADFAQLRNGDGRPVDVCTAATLRIDDTTQNECIICMEVVCSEPLGERRRDIKNSTNFGACRTLTQNGRVRPFAQGEGECVNEDGFSSASFA